MADSIFPFIDTPEVVQTTTTLPMAREYAWDLENNDFLLENGKFKIVEGIEAIKIWLWKIFNTPRYMYLAYSWNYGHELESLIGQGYTPAVIQSEVKRLIEEAIWPSLDGYVTAIRDMEISATNDALAISFIAVTPYGETIIYV